MKKLLSTILAIAMVLSLVTVNVVAEGPVGTEVADAATLKTCLTDGTDCYLSADIQLTEPLTTGAAVTLDLYGHTITPGTGFSGVPFTTKASASAVFTIKDTSEMGLGCITGFTDVEEVIYNKGTFTFESGAIESCTATKAIIRNTTGTTSKTINIDGGTIYSCTAPSMILANAGSSYAGNVVNITSGYIANNTTDESKSVVCSGNKDSTSNTVLNISGGTVESVYGVNSSKAVVNISGGYIDAFSFGASTKVSFTGGTFLIDPADYVTDGYEVEYDSDFGEYKVVKSEKKFAEVEMYGEITKYANFAEALQAVLNEGNRVNATIRLLEDTTIDSRLEFRTSKEDTNTYNLTIDTNGKELKYTGTNAGFLITVAGATITFTGDGTIDVGSKQFIYTVKGTTVNFESGTFKTTNSSMIYGDGTLNVFGGTYNFDPSAYVTEDSGYKVTAGDGTWTVEVDTETPVAAKIGNDEYRSLAAAVYAANNEAGSTISLQKDIVLSTNETFTFNVFTTLDLNGHSIVAAEGHTKRIFNINSMVTISDTSESHAGYITNAYATESGAVIYVNPMCFLYFSTVIKDSATTKSGGAIYSSGGLVYLMEGALIDNCSANKSGAIHLVRGTVNQFGQESKAGSALILYGGEISNCKAAVNAGAVSVGSQCSFMMMPGTTINKCYCEDTNGAQAVLVDVAGMVGRGTETEENEFGEFYYLGTIVSYDEQNAANDIISYGFVQTPDMEAQEVVLTDKYQKYTAAQFIDYQLALGEDLSFYINVQLVYAPGDENKTINAVLDETSIGEIRGIIDNGKGSYTIEVGGILPYQMSEDVKISITSDDYGDRKGLSALYCTSVEDYINELAEDESTSEELKALLAATVEYGSAAEEVAEGFEGFGIWLPSELDDYVSSETPEESDDCSKIIVRAKNPGEYKITSAQLNVADRIGIKVAFHTSDANAQLKVTTEEGTVTYSLSDCTDDGYGNYTILLERINPDEYDLVYSFALTNANGKVMNEIQYSVNSYCYRMNGKTENYDNFILAAYRYGKAADAYLASLK